MLKRVGWMSRRYNYSKALDILVMSAETCFNLASFHLMACKKVSFK